MSEVWINFYNKLNGKKLCGYTQRGTSQGELEATVELISYDNNIEIYNIEVRYEVE